jgi:hypothetical protein
MTTKKKPTKASGAAALDAVAVDGAVDVPLKDEVTLGIVEGSKASTARKDTYAFLHSRSRTSEARQLISEVYDSITEWEAQTGARSYKRRARSANTFVNALERVVGDLLRAKADPSRSGRLFRPIGRDRFKYDPIKHDVFKRVVDDLKGLELVGHALGKPRYFKIPEEWGGGSIARTGEGKASRFWATPKLLALAEHHGIHRDNVRAHFRPEPPLHPLVLTGPSRGRGRHKERGEIIKNFPRTPQTEKLEADVRELNAFLDQCEIAGGGHEGYTRRFNLGTTTFDKGGRLSSRGEECYQLKKPAERLKMSINGEAVC